MPAGPSCLLEPIWVEFFALTGGDRRAGYVSPDLLSPVRVRGPGRHAHPRRRVAADRPFYSGMHRSGIQRTPGAACRRRRYQRWTFVLMLYLLAHSSVVALFALSSRETPLSTARSGTHVARVQP